MAIDHSVAAQSRAAQISDAIRLSRVICIVGVVYAHSWTGLDPTGMAATSQTPQGLLRWGLVEIFGRSAVPLLGMIAGWLVVGSVKRQPYFAFLAGKARAILAPMVLWNGLAIALVCGGAALGWIAAPRLTSLEWLIDELFCLTKPNDINVQNPFLRDLFVCMALAPALTRAPTLALAGIIAGSLLWVLSGVQFVLLLRPSILLFFAIGMLARRMDIAALVGRLPIAILGLPFILLAGLRVWLEAGTAWTAAPIPLTAGLDVLLRLAAAAFVWATCWRLAKTKAGATLMKLEPYVFLVFCDHLILMWIGGPVIGRLTGPLSSPLYVPFLLLQPVLILLASVALGRGLVRLSPPLARLLSGGRLGAPPATAKA
jgi:hypothetical protein